MKSTSALTLNNSMFMKPRHSPPSAWAGHLPFAGWIIEELRPRVLVELGTHNGASYLGFCQAVQENALASKCFAVDTWQGDEHAGNYGEEVYAALNEINAGHYGEFSQLLRMTFDEALGYFADGSVDLLHIDGLHTYEAVRHDFDTWLPKLSDRGVILFHDTMVRERNFGVWKLWADLAGKYPAFEFQHAHGLGVLLVGKDLPDSVVALPALAKSGQGTSVLRLFDGLATRNEHYLDGESAARTRQESGQQLAACQALLAEANVQLGRADAYARVQTTQAEHLAAQLSERELRLQDMQQQLAAAHADATQREALVAELAARDRHLLQLQERVEHAHGQFAGYESALAAANSQLHSADRHAKDSVAQLGQLVLQLQETDQHARELQQRVEQAHLQFADYEAALAAVNAQLRRADEHAQANVAHTAELGRVLADREQRLQALQVTLAAANTRMAELEARARADDEALALARRQLADAEQSLRARTQELDRASAQLQALVESRSWRWTRPVRKLAGLFGAGGE